MNPDSIPYTMDVPINIGLIETLKLYLNDFKANEKHDSKIYSEYVFFLNDKIFKNKTVLYTVYTVHTK